MSTPITSKRLSYLKSTSSAVLSPQTRRSTVGSSIGSDNSLNESPQLPIVLNEDDARERREKRKSRSLAQATSSSRIVVEDAQGETAKLTNDQLASHYINCIKLSTENKITAKNAFNLHLIDHMNEMLKQRCEGSLNFQMAGGTIFASAKIYASRVDAVHTEAYKVLSSLGRGSDKDVETDGNEVEPEHEKQVGKKKKKRSNILENTSISLRFKNLEASFPTDPLDHYYSSLFDVARIDGLLINHVDMFDDGITLRFDSDLEPTYSHNMVGSLKRTSSSDPSPSEEDTEEIGKEQNKEIDDFLFTALLNVAKSDETKKKMICPTFANFDWSDEGWADDRISDRDACSTELKATILSGEDDDIDMDSMSNDLEEPVFTDELKPDFNDPDSTLQGAIEPDLLTSFKPGEYSYFKPRAFSTWEGPNHWKMRRVPNSVANTETSAGSDQTKKGKKRKRNFYIDFTKREVDEAEFKSSKKAKEVTKRILDKWNKSEEDRLLPDAGEYNVLDLAKCVLQEEVQIRPVTLIRSEKKEAIAQIHSDGFPVYNYDNPNDRNNYCPVMSDNEEEDMADAPDNDDLPPDFTNCDYNGTMDGFPDLTMSQTQMLNENSMQESLLKEDFLISQPRKIEKISIAYAKKSTRIDVRRLKLAMWTVLQNRNTEAEERSLQDNGMQDDEDDPLEDGSGDAKQTEDVSFSNLYGTLPRLIPNQMAENLSVPLAFNCLLHLANEKNLKIESCSDMSDLRISKPSYDQ